MSSWSDLKNNPRLREIYKKRIEIIRLIREFFWSQGFVETETPIAVRLASQEPYLNPIPVAFHDPSGREEKFYLHTSPEFALKKLLAAGFEKIFEICKTFRDYEEFGGAHNTEFTMIEWYRAPGRLEEIMDDTENLFKHVCKQLSALHCHADIFSQWDRKSMKEVWREHIGVNLDEFLEFDKLSELAKSKKYNVSDEDEYEDLFFKIFLNEIEPKLGLKKPTFINDYPAQMTSLCRLCDHDKRYAERFELYIAGLELANAFGELTDADEQKKKLERDRALRAKLGKPTWDVDEDFIEALKSGIPPAGGIALGVDRMVLLLTGARNIDEVIFQSVSDQIENKN